MNEPTVAADASGTSSAPAPAPVAPPDPEPTAEEVVVRALVAQLVKVAQLVREEGTARAAYRYPATVALITELGIK